MLSISTASLPYGIKWIINIVLCSSPHLLPVITTTSPRVLLAIVRSVMCICLLSYILFCPSYHAAPLFVAIHFRFSRATEQQEGFCTNLSGWQRNGASCIQIFYKITHWRWNEKVHHEYKNSKRWHIRDEHPMHDIYFVH